MQAPKSEIQNVVLFWKLRGLTASDDPSILFYFILSTFISLNWNNL